MTDEANPKIKAALLLAARRQADLEYALEDLEEVLKEVAPNEPIPSELFSLNDSIDKLLMEFADRHKVDVPDPQRQT